MNTFKKEDALGFFIGRAYRTMSNQMNKKFVETGLDLTIEQFIVLVNLWEEDGQSQQTFADKIYKEKSSITRLITNMEKRNLVVRIPDKQDKRNKLIYLTHQGKTLQETVIPIVQGMMNIVHTNISKEDMTTCKRVLTQIFENFNKK